jgi:hypothetical protein
MTDHVAASTGACMCGAVRFAPDPSGRLQVTGSVDWTTTGHATRRGVCKVCGFRLFEADPASGAVRVFMGFKYSCADIRLNGQSFAPQETRILTFPEPPLRDRTTGETG